MPKPSEVADQNTDKQDAPMSIRESIMAAKTELEEKDNPSENEEDEVEDKKEKDLLDDDLSDDPFGEGILPEAKTKKAKTQEEEPTDKVTDSDALESEVDDKEPQEDKKAKKTQIAAPENWKDTADWDKTPASVRQKIIKREEEVSAGFKQYGDKARAFDEFEQIIGPRRQSMAKVGVTPVQVIQRALDWMDALGHPDPNIRGQSLKLLSRNFGIDINQLADGNNSGGESFRVDGGNPQGNEIPEAVRQHISNLENRLSQFEGHLGQVATTFQSQQDRNALTYLQEWSKDKPYFHAVQSQMVNLIQREAVPLKDGALDLDAVYNMAIESNPQIKRLIELETKEKARADAKAKLEADRKKKQQQTQSARAASSSLKTGASSTAIAKTDGRGLSVREAIKLAQQQLNGS